MIKRKRNMRKLLGMTLLEIMIAVFISSVILVGIAGVVVASARLNSEQKAVREAAELSERKIEEFRRVNFAALTSGSDVVGKYSRVWTISSVTGEPRLKSVSLVVTWKDSKNRTHNQEFNTKVYRNAYPYK